MIEVEFKDLGGNFWGWAYLGQNKIEIEEKLEGLNKLYTLVHELLHLVEPKMSEKRVVKISDFISKGLWEIQNNAAKQ